MPEEVPLEVLHVYGWETTMFPAKIQLRWNSRLRNSRIWLLLYVN